jgi:hypothetical protein
MPPLYWTHWVLHPPLYSTQWVPQNCCTQLKYLSTPLYSREVLLQVTSSGETFTSFTFTFTSCTFNVWSLTTATPLFIYSLYQNKNKKIWSVHMTGLSQSSVLKFCFQRAPCKDSQSQSPRVTIKFVWTCSNFVRCQELNKRIFGDHPATCYVSSWSGPGFLETGLHNLWFE